MMVYIIGILYNEGVHHYTRVPRDSTKNYRSFAHYITIDKNTVKYLCKEYTLVIIPRNTSQNEPQAT